MTEVPLPGESGAEMLPSDPFDRLEALGTALRGVSQQLHDVAQASRDTSERLQKVADSSDKTRHLAIGLAVSLVLDVVLTVVVTLLTISALDQGSSIHQSQLAACAIGNQTRQEQEQLWVYVADLTSPAGSAQTKKFLAVVDKALAPLDCKQLYSK